MGPTAPQRRLVQRISLRIAPGRDNQTTVENGKGFQVIITKAYLQSDSPLVPHRARLTAQSPEFPLVTANYLLSKERLISPAQNLSQMGVAKLEKIS
jgi:hypothetical protein